MIDGGMLIRWGFKPGPWFKKALERANRWAEQGGTEEEIRRELALHAPTPAETIRKQDGSLIPCHYNIDADPSDLDEIENLQKVRSHMQELATLPTVRAMAVMPDACPAGGDLGTIPVGGVVVAENAIHPGMHSNDICCSVAISVFGDDVDPRSLLDAGMKITHFGMGGRPHSNDMQVPDALLAEFERNRFLRMMTVVAQEHFATQGDGNHFYYVGRLESTGQVALVTHHGSRKPGAELYKLGIQAACAYTSEVCPEVPKHNAWIPADSAEGLAYWEALQLIRRWTKKNHFAIHDAVAKYLGLKLKDRYWNEHNFVFERDGLYFHAKGATPNYRGFSSDWSNKTLIPLNMAAPILICETHEDTDHGLDFVHNSLGFCPHGAGRNLSRTGFMKILAERGLTPKEMIAHYTALYDIRHFCERGYDISEFPEAYKSPETIIQAIERYDLTTVVDRVLPVGSIMAGHSGWERRTKTTKQA